MPESPSMEAGAEDERPCTTGTAEGIFWGLSSLLQPGKLFMMVVIKRVMGITAGVEDGNLSI